ncbi:hypothetical protein SPURM210S_04121 [Streptomyces purpurascens]
MTSCRSCGACATSSGSIEGSPRCSGTAGGSTSWHPGGFARLADPGPRNAELRQQIWATMRDLDRDGLSPVPWPPLYGDTMSVRPVYPRQHLTLTSLQYRSLARWAAGDFVADHDPSAVPPENLDAVPLRAAWHARPRGPVVLSGRRVPPGVRDVLADAPQHPVRGTVPGAAPRSRHARARLRRDADSADGARRRRSAVRAGPGRSHALDGGALADRHRPLPLRLLPRVRAALRPLPAHLLARPGAQPRPHGAGLREGDRPRRAGGGAPDRLRAPGRVGQMAAAGPHRADERHGQGLRQTRTRRTPHGCLGRPGAAHDDVRGDRGELPSGAASARSAESAVPACAGGGGLGRRRRGRGPRPDGRTRRAGDGQGYFEKVERFPDER